MKSVHFNIWEIYDSIFNVVLVYIFPPKINKKHSILMHDN